MERQDKDLMVSADAVTEAEKEGKKKLRKEQWKNFWQKGFMLIVIIILIILLLAKCDSGGFRTPVVDEPNVGTEQTDKRPTFSTDLDENAQEGTDIGKSKEEIQKELNEKVAKNYINVAMNSFVNFENGEAMGNLGIVNEESNNYPQVIQIYLIEHGKLVCTINKDSKQGALTYVIDEDSEQGALVYQIDAMGVQGELVYLIDEDSDQVTKVYRIDANGEKGELVYLIDEDNSQVSKVYQADENGKQGALVYQIDENDNQVTKVYQTDKNGKQGKLVYTLFEGDYQGELVYQSAMLPVGSSIPSAKLKVNLEKGTHDAIAHFNAVNAKDGSYIGKACASVKLNILN